MKFQAFSLLVVTSVLSGCQISTSYTETYVGGLPTPSEGMAPAVTEKTSLTFADGAVPALAISSPINEFEATVSPDKNIYIEASISAKDLETVKAFKSKIQVTAESDKISVRLNTSNVYRCRSRVTGINGQVRRQVDGTCVHDVKIALPKNSITKVTVNDFPAAGIADLNIGQLAGVLSNHSSDSQRLETVQKFAELHKERILMADLEAVVRTFFADSSKVEAIEVFAKNGFSDPQYVHLILKNLFSDSSKSDVASTVFRHVPHGVRNIEMAQVTAAVRTVFSDSTKISLCESFSGHVLDRENAHQIFREFFSDSSKSEAIRLLAR